MLDDVSLSEDLPSPSRQLLSRDAIDKVKESAMSGNHSIRMLMNYDDVAEDQNMCPNSRDDLIADYRLMRDEFIVRRSVSPNNNKPLTAVAINDADTLAQLEELDRQNSLRNKRMISFNKRRSQVRRRREESWNNYKQSHSKLVEEYKRKLEHFGMGSGSELNSSDDEIDNKDDRRNTEKLSPRNNQDFDVKEDPSAIESKKFTLPGFYIAEDDVNKVVSLPPHQLIQSMISTDDLMHPSFIKPNSSPDLAASRLSKILRLKFSQSSPQERNSRAKSRNGTNVKNGNKDDQDAIDGENRKVASDPCTAVGDRAFESSTLGIYSVFNMACEETVKAAKIVKSQRRKLLTGALKTNFGNHHSGQMYLNSGYNDDNDDEEENLNSKKENLPTLRPLTSIIHHPLVAPRFPSEHINVDAIENRRLKRLLSSPSPGINVMDALVVERSIRSGEPIEQVLARESRNNKAHFAADGNSSKTESSKKIIHLDNAQRNAGLNCLVQEGVYAGSIAASPLALEFEKSIAKGASPVSASLSPDHARRIVLRQLELDSFQSVNDSENSFHKAFHYGDKFVQNPSNAAKRSSIKGGVTGELDNPDELKDALMKLMTITHENSASLPFNEYLGDTSADSESAYLGLLSTPRNKNGLVFKPSLYVFQSSVLESDFPSHAVEDRLGNDTSNINTDSLEDISSNNKNEEFKKIRSPGSNKLNQNCENYIQNEEKPSLPSSAKALLTSPLISDQLKMIYEESSKNVVSKKKISAENAFFPDPLCKNVFATEDNDTQHYLKNSIGINNRIYDGDCERIRTLINVDLNQESIDSLNAVSGPFKDARMVIKGVSDLNDRQRDKRWLLTGHPELLGATRTESRNLKLRARRLTEAENVFRSKNKSSISASAMDSSGSIIKLSLAVNKDLKEAPEKLKSTLSPKGALTTLSGNPVQISWKKMSSSTAIIPKEGVFASEYPDAYVPNLDTQLRSVCQKISNLKTTWDDSPPKIVHVGADAPSSCGVPSIVRHQRSNSLRGFSSPMKESTSPSHGVKGKQQFFFPSDDSGPPKVTESQTCGGGNWLGSSEVDETDLVERFKRERELKIERTKAIEEERRMLSLAKAKASSSSSQRRRQEKLSKNIRKFISTAIAQTSLNSNLLTSEDQYERMLEKEKIRIKTEVEFDDAIKNGIWLMNPDSEDNNRRIDESINFDELGRKLLREKISNNEENAQLQKDFLLKQIHQPPSHPQKQVSNEKKSPDLTNMSPQALNTSRRHISFRQPIPTDNEDKNSVLNVGCNDELGSGASSPQIIINSKQASSFSRLSSSNTANNNTAGNSPSYLPKTEEGNDIETEEETSSKWQSAPILPPVVCLPIEEELPNDAYTPPRLVHLPISNIVATTTDANTEIQATTSNINNSSFIPDNTLLVGGAPPSPLKHGQPSTFYHCRIPIPKAQQPNSPTNPYLPSKFDASYLSPPRPPPRVAAVESQVHLPPPPKLATASGISIAPHWANLRDQLYGPIIDKLNKRDLRTILEESRDAAVSRDFPLPNLKATKNEPAGLAIDDWDNRSNPSEVDGVTGQKLQFSVAANTNLILKSSTEIKESKLQEESVINNPPHVVSQRDQPLLHSASNAPLNPNNNTITKNSFQQSNISHPAVQTLNNTTTYNNVDSRTNINLQPMVVTFPADDSSTLHMNNNTKRSSNLQPSFSLNAVVTSPLQSSGRVEEEETILKSNLIENNSSPTKHSHRNLIPMPSPSGGISMMTNLDNQDKDTNQLINQQQAINSDDVDDQMVIGDGVNPDVNLQSSSTPSVRSEGAKPRSPPILPSAKLIPVQNFIPMPITATRQVSDILTLQGGESGLERSSFIDKEGKPKVNNEIINSPVVNRICPTEASFYLKDADEVSEKISYFHFSSASHSHRTAFEESGQASKNNNIASKQNIFLSSTKLKSDSLFFNNTTSPSFSNLKAKAQYPQLRASTSSSLLSRAASSVLLNSNWK